MPTHTAYQTVALHRRAKDGASGLSAYEIWLKTHPGKSEAEFLESIIGASGRSVKTITEYYARNNDEKNAPTSGWSTTLVNPDKQNLFLWNKETVIDDKGKEIVTTTPVLIARYTEDGRGIKSITEYYVLSTTTDIASKVGEWGTAVPTLTVVNRYLWNYEHIEYTDGTTEDTKKAIIGVYGDTGQAGRNAIYADLTNEFDSMLYTGDGEKITDKVTSIATLYDGGVPQNNVTWQASIVSGCEASVQANGIIEVYGMSATDGYVLAYAEYKKQTYSVKFTLKKLVGVDKYEITTSQAAIVYNASTKKFDNGKANLDLTVNIYVTKQNKSRAPLTSLPKDFALTCNGNPMTYASGKATIAVSSAVSAYAFALSNGTTPLDAETVILSTVSDGDASVQHAIVFAKSQLMEGETGTDIYLVRTKGGETPQRVTLAQMDAENIKLSGTGVQPTDTGYRLYVEEGVKADTDYTVIAKKDNTEIARATLGVSKKGDSTYLAQVTPDGLEIQTDNRSMPLIESAITITHNAERNASFPTRFCPFVMTKEQLEDENTPQAKKEWYNRLLPDYDLFKSCNKGMNDSASRMTIRFRGMEEITFYYSSYAESTYDYLMLSHLNTALPAGCSYQYPEVAHHTHGNQTAGISNAATYKDLDPTKEYFIEVMFTKDSSQSKDDDCGYIAVPHTDIVVPAQKYTLRPSMQNATGRVAFDFAHASLLLPTDNGYRYEPDYPDLDPEKPEEEQHLGGEYLNLYVTANRPIKPCDLLLPVTDGNGTGGTQTVRVPVTPIIHGVTTSIYTLDIPAVIPVGTEDFGIVVVRTTGDETKRLTYEEAIADGIDVRGDHVEWYEYDQQFYLAGGAKEGTYRILLYRNDVKIQEYPVRCIKGDTGNSLNWILWSAVQNTQHTFHSKQSVGDTNIADIVIDDISTENGIHTNRKYVCIRDFDHAPSSTDTPFDYSDKKEPRPDVVYFAQLNYLGNVATGILVSDEISTQILHAVNARIDELIVKRLRTAANGCRIEMEGGAMKVFADGNTNPNIVFGVVNGSAVLSYYNNNGQKLYDLGPEGIMQATHAFFAAYSDRTLRTAGVSQGYMSLGQNATYYLWTQGEKTLEGGGVRNYTKSDQDTGWQSSPFTESGKMFATKTQGALPSNPLNGWYVDAWYGQDEIYGGITSSNVAVVNAYHYTNGAVDKSGQIFYQAGTVYFCTINGNRLSGITSIDNYMQKTGQ